MKLTREHIPVGRENAVTRRQLCEATGLNDREVRKQISQLRSVDDGTDMVIVSLSNGRGYYRTNNPDEIRHFIAEMRKRNRMVFRTIRTAELVAHRIEMGRQYGKGLVG